jgi:hypothetical protein
MKKWYESKTVWFNFVAFLAVLLQAQTGHVVLNVETQGVILTGINMILRLITKHKIDWSKGDAE